MSLGVVAVAGSHGFIGSKLCERLKNEGYDVWPIVRRPTKKQNEIFYDYEQKEIDIDKLSQCMAVINLAGKNIMSGLWTKQFKKELYDSRVKSTRFISHTLSKLNHGPQILLNASAIGIYGDHADLKLDETSSYGHDFLAKLCIDWERGTLFAKEAGIRVVNMRFGVVLDPQGGMLKAMVPIFKLGLGGYIGNGEQYFSYIIRDELIRAIVFALKNNHISGPVNMVALEPITNREFALALGHVLKSRVWLRAPTALLKLLGDQAATFLGSLRVYPKVLIDNHFKFDNHRPIEQVLANILNYS